MKSNADPLTTRVSVETCARHNIAKTIPEHRASLSDWERNFVDSAIRDMSVGQWRFSQKQEALLERVLSVARKAQKAGFKDHDKRVATAAKKTDAKAELKTLQAAAIKAGTMSDWESRFMGDIIRRGFNLSAKQAAIVKKIQTKLDKVSA